MPDRVLSYVVFNAGWDLAVGNTLNQLRQPAAGGQSQDATKKYLEYLACSLESFVRCHPGTSTCLRIWLVELSPDGLKPQQLRDFLAERVPGLSAEIAVLGHTLVRPFIEEARRVPVEHYRSPNRLHEFALLQVLQRTRERHLAFADPDLVFLAPGALDLLWARLAAHPQKWAAAFVEQPKRQPWQDGWMTTRARMHSVVVLFDSVQLREHLPFELLSEPDLRARLLPLRDEEAVRHYTAFPVLDTFSLLTEYLRSNWFVDRLLDLGTTMERYHEGSMLTIVCELLVHVKHREPGARASLADAIERAGLTRTAGLEKLLASCS